MVIISNLWTGVTGGDTLGYVAPDAYLWPQVSSVRGPPGVPVHLHTTSAGEGIGIGLTVHTVWGMCVDCTQLHLGYGVLFVHPRLCMFCTLHNNDHMTLFWPQESLCQGYVERAIDLLKNLNSQVSTHPNFHIYSQLQNLVDFDGFYLENEPCLVCNDPEIPYSVSNTCDYTIV